MSRWQLETSPAFDRAARKLDPTSLKRIRTYLEEVCALDDPRMRGKALGADRAGYWRYRIGNYRVIASIEDHRLIVIAIALGHRSDIHRR